MAAGVVGAAVTALRDLGATSLQAVVGPSVCARCYEVPAALRDDVAEAVPVAASVSATGTPAIDVAAGVLQQLHDVGVPVEVVRGCTVERPDLFSHRRDGVTGRFAGVVALHGPDVRERAVTEGGDRSAELGSALAAVRERIAAACAAARRDPAELTLVVVTKTYPLSDVRLLADLGVRDVGEARVAEGGEKAQGCTDLDLVWHAIGQVQTKKANALARWAHVVHSVDRERLVTALGRGAELAGRDLDVLAPGEPRRRSLTRRRTRAGGAGAGRDRLRHNGSAPAGA